MNTDKTGKQEAELNPNQEQELSDVRKQKKAERLGLNPEGSALEHWKKLNEERKTKNIEEDSCGQSHHNQHSV